MSPEPNLEKHTCDWCREPATHCYREGRGTGHSEHVCACAEHKEEQPQSIWVR